MSCPGPYLSDWLNAIATWSDSQPQHASITLTIDIKDDLNDNLNVENGNLIALNRILSETLGQKMVLAEQWTAPWPSIESLRGSIIVVLGGHEGPDWPTFRTVDNAGWVVEVHQSSIRPALFYRIGRLDENHGIT